MNRISSERASKPSNLLRERLDGFDALSDDIRFIFLMPFQMIYGSSNERGAGANDCTRAVGVVHVLSAAEVDGFGSISVRRGMARYRLLETRIHHTQLHQAALRPY